MKKVLILVFVCFISMFTSCKTENTQLDNSTNTEMYDSPSNINQYNPYEYVDSFGGIYRIEVRDDYKIYNRTIDALLSEWDENVAAAEFRYVKDPNALIMTEGFINDIRKQVGNGHYYITLTSDTEDWTLFGSTEVDVFFNDNDLEVELLNYKKGDFIVIVVSAYDTTLTLEHPKLNAIAIPEKIASSDLNETGEMLNIADLENAYRDAVDKAISLDEYWRKVLIISLCCEDIDAYLRGAHSAFVYESGGRDELFVKYGDDYEAYLDGKTSRYNDYWIRLEDAYYQFSEKERETLLESKGSFYSEYIKQKDAIGYVEIQIDELFVRDEPSSRGQSFGFAEQNGIYEIYDIISDGTYLWYQIGINRWVADNNGEWVRYVAY